MYVRKWLTSCAVVDEVQRLVVRKKRPPLLMCAVTTGYYGTSETCHFWLQQKSYDMMLHMLHREGLIRSASGSQHRTVKLFISTSANVSISIDDVIDVILTCTYKYLSDTARHDGSLRRDIVLLCNHIYGEHGLSHEHFTHLGNHGVTADVLEHCLRIERCHTFCDTTDNRIFWTQGFSFTLHKSSLRDIRKVHCIHLRCRRARAHPHTHGHAVRVHFANITFASYSVN